MVKSYLVSALILLCVAIIETAIISNITFLPAIPDLLLICSIYFSLLNGRGMGEFSGFLSGFFIDFLSGTPFGFNCIFRTIIGYVIGWFGSSINYRGFFIPTFIGFIATLLKVFLIWMISLFFPAVSSVYSIVSIPFLFELVVNALLTPFIFKILSSFDRMTSLSSSEGIA